MTLYPHARVVTLLPLGVFTQLVQVPAVFFLGFWFLQQFLFGVFALGGPGGSGGVAWWAHIGGFAAGLALIVLLKKRGKSERPRRDAWWEERYAGRRPRGW